MVHTRMSILIVVTLEQTRIEEDTRIQLLQNILLHARFYDANVNFIADPSFVLVMYDGSCA